MNDIMSKYFPPIDYSTIQSALPTPTAMCFECNFVITSFFPVHVYAEDNIGIRETVNMCGHCRERWIQGDINYYTRHFAKMHL